MASNSDIPTMKIKDYVNTLAYLNSYGKNVVKIIKQRIKNENLIDTGRLYRSIDYRILTKDNATTSGFNVVIFINDRGNKKGTPPSVYGQYQDGRDFTTGEDVLPWFLKKSKKHNYPTLFFTEDIPGYTQDIFEKKLQTSILKDFELFTKKLQIYLTS